MANTKKYVSLDKLGLYDEKIKKVISDGDSEALKSAKAYADGLAVNYDAAGSASTALTNANSYTDGQISAVNSTVAGVKTIAEQGVSDAALAQAAADKAQGDVDGLKAYVGTIPEGATATNVVAYIQEKTAGIATEGAMTELGNRVGVVEGKVATIEGDYLKAADKTELEGKITGVESTVNTLSGTHATDKKALEDAIALKADQTALDAVSGVANAAVKQSDYDTKVAALEAEDERIAGLVATEQSRAEGIETGLNSRLEKVEAFFKGAAEDEGEGENLQNALDTLVEIQEYINNDGAAADQMVKDIAANKKAIEDHAATDHDFASADTALKSELNGEIAKKADKTTVEGIDGRLTTAEGKVSTLEGKMTDVEGAVATKAEKTYVDDEIAKLVTADTGLGNRISALEAKHGDGEGTVESLIATAKQEAIVAAAADASTKANTAETNAKGYADGLNTAMDTRVEALETASATHALASDLTALAGRVSTAEGEIDTLQTEMDAVEALAAANKAAHEANAAAIALKASQADLDTVSGRVTALETWHNNFTEVSEEEINALFA